MELWFTCSFRDRSTKTSVLADGGRRGRFVGDEAARFVRAIAEWALGRLAAAAEGDCGFARGNFEFGAAGVDEPEGAFDHEWAIGAHADGDFRHRCSLRCSRPLRGGGILKN